MFRTSIRAAVLASAAVTAALVLTGVAHADSNFVNPNCQDGNAGGREYHGYDYAPGSVMAVKRDAQNLVEQPERMCGSVWWNQQGTGELSVWLEDGAGQRVPGTTATEVVTGPQVFVHGPSVPAPAFPVRGHAG